jgi:hypothetical protein
MGIKSKVQPAEGLHWDLRNSVIATLSTMT